MVNQGLSLALIVIAVLLLLVALRMLLRRNWLLVWVRGTLGFFVLFSAIVVALTAVDLHSYASATDESEVAVVRIEKLGDQQYRVTLTPSDLEPGESPEVYDLRGDLWQLDARVITWGGPLKAVGLEPVYRLDRLSGRYLSLEQERSGERSVYAIRQSGVGDSGIGLDLWHWLHENQWFPWIDADYGAATYMPLRNGAEYEVSLSNRGMLARPVNAAAVDAVGSWH